MPAPYNIKRNYRGCSGWSVVGADGKSHGCIKSRAMAIRQQRALYAATNAKKAEEISVIEDTIAKEYEAEMQKEQAFWSGSRFFKKK
jgi:hypothetical protein